MQPIPKSILYCYSEYHDRIPMLQSGGVTIHQGLPDDQIIESLAKPALLILDDLMLNASEEYLTSLFTKKIHHKNTSVIFLTELPTQHYKLEIWVYSFFLDNWIIF